jgi:catechol 2,3-dioxygenase
MSVTRLGHVGLVVTDLDAYGEYLREGLGLREVRREGDRAWYGLGSRHHQVRLSAGDAPGCDGIGFDVADEQGLESLRGAVDAAGLKVVREEPIDDTVARGFSFAVPEGPVVELCLGAATDPGPGVDANDFYRVRGPSLGIRKLGHVTIGSPNPPAVERVFVDVLGFRISDRFQEVLSWARCNADHHSAGFAPAAAPGIHHLAYELESFADYERLADHLARRGTRFVWGPGRHGPGNNVFAYYEDPDGTLTEIYTDMIKIENEDSYEPHEWDDLQEVGNSWGPLPEQSWFEKLTPFRVPVEAE